MTSRTALLVDDNVLLARYTRAFLASRLPDLQVVLAHDGKAARAAFERTAPCLVVLDVRLPDASGVELLREFASCARPTAFILISAEDIATGLERELRHLGLVGALGKPYGAEQIAELIRRALRRMAEPMDLAAELPMTSPPTEVAVDPTEMRRELSTLLAGLFEIRARLSVDPSEQAVRGVVESQLLLLTATASRLSRIVTRPGCPPHALP